MKNFANNSEIPLGFGMSLAQNLPAMNYFSNLSENAKRQIIEQTHSISSKEEMQSFVSYLGNINQERNLYETE